MIKEIKRVQRILEKQEKEEERKQFDDIDYLYLLDNDNYTMNFAAITDNQLVMLDNKEDKALINTLIPLFLNNISKNMLEDLEKNS